MGGLLLWAALLLAVRRRLRTPAALLLLKAVLFAGVCFWIIVGAQRVCALLLGVQPPPVPVPEPPASWPARLVAALVALLGLERRT